MLSLDEARKQAEAALAALGDLALSPQEEEPSSLDTFCPNCDLVQIDDDHIYCTFCGYDLFGGPDDE